MRNIDYNDNNGYDFDSYIDDMLEDSVYHNDYDDCYNDFDKEDSYGNELNFSSPTFEQASFSEGRIVFQSHEIMDDDIEPGYGETDYANTDYINNELIVKGIDIDGDGSIDDYDLWDESSVEDRDY